MGRDLFNEYMAHRRQLSNGGDPGDGEKPDLFTGDWHSHTAATMRGAFPKMYHQDEEEYPNLNLSKAGFMAIAMSQFYGWDGPIRLTSGERLGYDQWRVMKQYQYPQNMNLYNRRFRKIIEDSIDHHGYNTPLGDKEIINWVEEQYKKYEQGIITERELHKLVSNHMTGDAGDFTHGYQNWLKSGESKDFRKDFKIVPLDEKNHFHVPFYDIDPSNLPDNLQAHYSWYSDMFDKLAFKNNRGQLRISMNPSHYTMDQLSGFSRLTTIPIQELEIQPSDLLLSEQPIKSIPLQMPEPSEDKNIFRRIRNKDFKIFNKQYGGSSNEWLENVRKFSEQHSPQTNLYADVNAIKRRTPLVFPYQTSMKHGGDPNMMWPPDPQDLDPNYKPPVIQEDVKEVTVDNDGWANLDFYRSKKDDGQFILNTQNYLLDKGFDLSTDGLWGDQTYKTINKYLINKQLDNYNKTNFSESQFQDQIYKESAGRNDRVSSAGAMGIAQFKPETFAWMKEKGWLPATARIIDPAAQSLAQRRYMDYLYEDRTNIKSAGKDKEERQARAFAAYNMGPSNFDGFWNKLSAEDKKAGWETWYKKLNKETKFYIMWMFDRDTYAKDHPKGYHNVSWGYDNWKKKNKTYRYKYGGVPQYKYGGPSLEDATYKAHRHEINSMENDPDVFREAIMNSVMSHYTSGDGGWSDMQDDKYSEYDGTFTVHGLGKSDVLPYNEIDLRQMYEDQGYFDRKNKGDYKDLWTFYSENPYIKVKGNRLIGYNPSTGKELGNYFTFPKYTTPKISTEDLKTLPVSETDMTASTVDVSESADIGETKDPKFHHRKFKEVDGKYYAYNPVMDKNVNTRKNKGDGWYSITKNTFDRSIKDANLNPNTGEYEAWWHEGGLKDGNITNESVLSYLQDKDLSELIKGT